MINPDLCIHRLLCMKFLLLYATIPYTCPNTRLTSQPREVSYTDCKIIKLFLRTVYKALERNYL